MDKIVAWFRAWKEARSEKQAQSDKNTRAQMAISRFNIIDHNDIPVIALDGIIITVPNEKQNGDALIKQLIELRKIYVEG